MRPLKIGFAGSGNLAWHLGPALENAGHQVTAVWNRTPGNAKPFIGRLYQAELLHQPEFTDADLVIIAVKDDAIEHVARELILPEHCIVAHTSGSVSLSKLGYLPTSQTAVFYPLQTFSRSKKIDFSRLPIFIESEDAATEKQLIRLAKTISKNVMTITAKRRAYLHVSAVIACNLTNHLHTLSKKIAEDQKIKFEWLYPLIIETVEKSLSMGPEKSQTGPAIRRDAETLDKHMSLLENYPDIQEIYRVITENILSHYE